MDDDSETFAFRKWNAILRLKYGIEDPDSLPVEKWAQLVEEYRYIYEMEQKTQENQRFMLEYNIKKTLYELANAIYGKK